MSNLKRSERNNGYSNQTSNDTTANSNNTVLVNQNNHLANQQVTLQTDNMPTKENPLKAALAQSQNGEPEKLVRSQNNTYNPLKEALSKEKKVGNTQKFNPLKEALANQSKENYQPKSANGNSDSTGKDDKKSKNKRSKRRVNKELILNIFIIVFLLCGAAGGAGAFYFVSKAVSASEKFDPGRVKSQNSSIILDMYGEIITDNIGKEARQIIKYEDLPQCVVDAFVAIEDSRFFTHNGFDMPRFARAAIENLRNFNFGQGGSTFTMQIIKNSYFLEEGSGGAVKSVERKIQEIAMAMDADSVLTKQEIFENYVNKINFGARGRGIQVASRYYFNKNVQDVGLSEAAMLAGVVNLPYGYNPFLDLEAAAFRRNEVLNMMEYHGYITAQECIAAKKIKVEDLLYGEDEYSVEYDTIPNQAYIDVVIKEVIELTGLDPFEVPMVIYTSFDPHAQKVVEDVQNGKYPSAKVNAHKYLNNAIIVLNHDFEIVAVGGGKNYNGQRMFNLATDMEKQSGSSMKPVLSYLLAYEHIGLTTGSYVYDGPMNYPGSGTRVVDYNNRYRGIISVTTAIVDSRNVPAVDLMQQVINAIGSEKVIEYMNSVGYSHVTSESFSTMDAIGGGSFLTSPLEMAGAYNMLMNLGEYVQPHTVLRIEFDDGRPAHEAQYQRVRVVSEAAAYLSAEVVRKNVATGAGKYSVLRRSHAVYSKSGTTDWGSIASRQLKLPVSNGSKDKWLITATTDYTIGVWIGFDKGVPGERTYYSDSMNNMKVPEHVTKVVLDALEKGKPKPKTLSKPNSVGSTSFIKGYLIHYAPFPGMPSDFITSGLNKSGTTILTQFIPEPLGEMHINDIKNISTSGVSGTNMTTLTVDVPAFFRPELMEIAPDKMQFPYGSRTFPGNRGNDITWWMGPVRYYVRIENASGGLVAVDTMSESSNINITFNSTGYSSGTQMRACAFYAYSNITDVRSSVDCRPFILP